MIEISQQKMPYLYALVLYFTQYRPASNLDYRIAAGWEAMGEQRFEIADLCQNL